MRTTLNHIYYAFQFSNQKQINLLNYGVILYSKSTLGSVFRIGVLYSSELHKGSRRVIVPVLLPLVFHIKWILFYQ